jgi:prepilin-type N-terminal cleavage/methylation domain-containing protein/prepilin-type processing-associated H-X9-DG protein
MVPDSRGNTMIQATSRRPGSRTNREPPCLANNPASRQQIINHPSSIVNATGFTLIELLVVIAIVALLMAILMPALQRVRKQARGIACQSNLHQWALIGAMYTEDSGGHFPREVLTWPDLCRTYHKEPHISLCPTATKLRSEGGQSPFAAWGTTTADVASYGLNQWVLNAPGNFVVGGREPARLWRTPNVNGAGAVPLFGDCFISGATPRDIDQPPDYDGQAAEWLVSGDINEMRRFCMNRHDGRMNALFLDWSVRAVGLKELWTLKWHRQFNTAGPWTQAGGARPEDWPPWMQRLKDY